MFGEKSEVGQLFTTWKTNSKLSRYFKVHIFCLSEKARKFCEISTLLLTVLDTDKSKVEISQNFMAFSEFLTKYNQKTSFVKTIWFVKRFIKAQKSFFIKNAVNSSIDFNLIIAPHARLCLSKLGGDISTRWE